jgi:peroxiredoxin
MKQLLFSTALFISIVACGQKPSPLAKATETINGGAVVTIDYSQPSVKGRTIGKDLEPMEGKVWRSGANDATVFEVSKDVKVEGQALAAGKYGFFTIVNGDEWTIIFNKTWKQWGAFNYKEADDALRVKVKGGKTKEFSEKMTFVVNKNGKVSLMWGDKQVDFNVK